MHSEKSERQANERRLHMGEHGSRRLPARARMHDHHKSCEHDGEHCEHAGGKRADPMARGRDHGDNQRSRRRPQRDVVTGPPNAVPWQRGVAVTRRERDGEREDDRIERERGGRRPLDQSQDRRDTEPQQCCDSDAEDDALALRERGIGEREDRDGGVGGHAADGGGGDEGGRVFHRQDDVGRARGRRQRGDERGDEGPATLGRDRHDDDDRRCHRHLEDEGVPEERIGGHDSSPSLPGPRHDASRPAGVR